MLNDREARVPRGSIFIVTCDFSKLIMTIIGKIRKDRVRIKFSVA